MRVNRKRIAVEWINTLGVIPINPKGSVEVDIPADVIRNAFFQTIRKSPATITSQTETGIRFKYPDEVCGEVGLGVYAMHGGRCIVDVQTF